jgi:hypothetical protein
MSVSKGVVNGRGFQKIEITGEQVVRGIKILQDNKAPGVDGLNTTFFKSCTSGLVRPKFGKTKIWFNESFSNG